MGRSPCCDAASLKRGPWTPEEDQKLLGYIQEHDGHGSWRSLPQKAGLQRCGKSCRLRWTNYLRPDIKRGNFNLQEEQTIIQLHALLGNRWSAIATHLPKRTDNEIKNYWNTNLKKQLAKMGIDPVTHKPKSAILVSADGAANLSYMAQWESTLLQAESSLVRESKVHQHQPSSSRSTSASVQLLNKMATTLAPRRCLDILTNVDSPTSTLSCSENAMPAAIGLSEFTGFSGLFGGEIVEACAMHHQDMVFDAGEEWIMESSDTKETNFNEEFTNLLLSNPNHDELNPSIGDIDCEPSDYWNDMLNLVNCGQSDSPVF